MAKTRRILALIPWLHTMACGGQTVSDGDYAHGRGASAARAGGNAPSGAADAANGGAGNREAAGGVPTGPGGTGMDDGGTSAALGGAPSGGDSGHCSGGTSNPGLIDDMEHGNGQILNREGRVGVWYAFNDTPGRTASGTQWPAPTTPGVTIPTSVIDGGRGCSTRAMRSYGGGFDYWGAGIGFDLGFDGQTYRTYDASAYAGITFWARGQPETIMQVRISTAATTRAEWGGTCPKEPCPLPHQTTLVFGSQWTQYWIPFSTLHQEIYNGAASFQSNQLTNVQFLVPLPFPRVSLWPYDTIQSFDFWVDDVAFYADPPPCCTALPACQGVIEFPDSKLERSVREAANRPAGDLTCQDACTLHVLATYGQELAGVECLANLSILSILGGSDPAITELGPLSHLVHLTRLQVSDGDISELGPLAGLTNLTILALPYQSITDVGPLASLTNLTKLHLGFNQLGDVSPLLALPRLGRLDVTSNPVCCNDPTLTVLRQRGVSVNCDSCS